MSDAGSVEAEEEIPFSNRSDGTGSIGGNLIEDLEDEAISEASLSQIGEPHQVDASFEESLDVPRTPPITGIASRQRGTHTEPPPRQAAHVRSNSLPSGGKRPTSASEGRMSIDSARKSGSPAFKGMRRSDVSSRMDDFSTATGASHPRRSARVVVRARPLLFSEKNDRELVYVNGQKIVLVNPASKADTSAIMALAARAADENYDADHFARAFIFDDCFWASPAAAPEDCNVTQDHVFDRVGEHLIEDAVSGKSVACFTYGATQSGKSFTMFGDLEANTVRSDGSLEFGSSTGLMVRVFSSIIERLSGEVLTEPLDPSASHQNSGENGATTTAPFYLSAIQIYLESIRDLFILDTDPATLKIRAGKDEPVVTDLDWEAVFSAGELLELLKIAEGNRQIVESEFDIPVARAHTVVTLKYTLLDGRKAQVYMVDLAGCEKETTLTNEKVDKRQSPNRLSAAAAQVINQRREETKWINRSLSNLGTILTNRGQGISVRDTKLTWFLKHALTGPSGHCTLIATVSPAERHFAATLDTLKYAARVTRRSVQVPVASADAPDPEEATYLQQQFVELRSEFIKSKEGKRDWHHQTVSDPRQRLAKMERGVAVEGPEPKEPVTPYILSTRPYVDTVDQEIQCDLIGDPQLELSNLRNKIASLESEVASLKTDKDAIELELEQEIERNHHATGGNEEEHYREIQALQEKLRQQEEYNEKLVNGIKALHRQREEDLNNLKRENENREKYMQQALDGRLRDNVGELANYRDEAEKLREQVDHLQLENLALKERFNEQAQELYDARMKALDKGSATEAREREIEALKKQLQQTEEQLRNADARHAVLARQLQQARDDLAAQQDLHAEISRLRKENDSLRAESQREIARLRAELEDALQRSRQLQQELEAEKAQMASTIRRLEQRQGALTRLESEGEGWARLQAALHGLLEREGAAMSSEVEDVRKLSDMLADARRKTEELYAIRRDLQREQQDHEQTRVQLAKLRSQLPRDRAQLAGDSALSEDFMQLQRKSQQQQVALERYRTELAKAKEEGEDWAARAREFQKLARDRAEIIRSTVAEKRREALPTVNLEELQQKLAALQAAKTSLTQENERLRGDASHARDAARRLKEHFQQYKESKDRELTAIWLAVHKLDMMDALKTATLEAVKKDRDHAMRESKSLNMELRQMSAECFDLHRELHGVDANLLAVADSEGIRVDDLRARTPSTTARSARPHHSASPSSNRHPSRGRSSSRASQHDHDGHLARSSEYADVDAHVAETNTRRGQPSRNARAYR